MKSFSILIVLLLLSSTVSADCNCGKVIEKFLPYAKKSSGIVAYVEVLGYQEFQLEHTLQVRYVELKLIENINGSSMPDTIKIKLSGLDCCTTNLVAGEVGQRAIINAHEWDESDYGFMSEEIQCFTLSACAVSSLQVEDGMVTGPVTRKKKQRMPMNRLIKKL